MNMSSNFMIEMMDGHIDFSPHKNLQTYQPFLPAVVENMLL